MGNPPDLGELQAVEAESVEENRLEVVDLQVNVPCRESDESELIPAANTAKRFLRIGGFGRGAYMRCAVTVNSG